MCPSPLFSSKVTVLHEISPASLNGVFSVCVWEVCLEVSRFRMSSWIIQDQENILEPPCILFGCLSLYFSGKPQTKLAKVTKRNMNKTPLAMVVVYQWRKHLLSSPNTTWHHQTPSFVSLLWLRDPKLKKSLCVWQQHLMVVTQWCLFFWLQV